jgi:hypothetical protein
MDEKLESIVNERKKEAIELKIGEKASFLAKSIGKQYQCCHSFNGGGLAGDMSFSENGHILRYKDIIIKDYINQDSEKIVSIDHNKVEIEKILEIIPIRNTTRMNVYLQKEKALGNEMEILRYNNPNSWRHTLEEAYSLEIGKKEAKEKAQKEQQKNSLFKEMNEKFGPLYLD